jgi:hypothetical protein
MLAPAPIDSDFVPYTKRRVLKRNAGLFVDGAGRGRATPRVTLQQLAWNFPCVQNCDGTTDGRCCGTNGAGRCLGYICWPPP